MSPSKIGRYEIQSEIGTGSMGVIFLAHDPFVQRAVVVKVLNYEFSGEEHHRDFFHQEAKIIASLEHPYIVPVYDFGWVGSQPYFVMRHMEGGSLYEIMAEPLSLAEVAEIVQRLCEALDAAHTRNIVHRDIKPGNILFDLKGKAYLADFGIAKSAEGVEDGEDWLVGTPSYMSPEQCLSQPVGPAADVYAMGVLMFKMLTGRNPFEAENFHEIMDQHINMPVPQMLSINPKLDPAWQEIVEKAMAKYPFERYASAGELAKDVATLASGRWHWRKLYSEDE